MKKNIKLKTNTKLRIGIRPYRVETLANKMGKKPSEAFDQSSASVKKFAEDLAGLGIPELSKMAKTNEESAESAKLRTELMDYQKRVIDKLKNQKGLVVAHGTGTGKTLSSIGAIVDLNPDKAQVFVPAALQDNYRKEIKKHVQGELPVEVQTIQKAVRDGKVPRGDLVIVDEAHKLKNPSAKATKLIKSVQDGKKMLLTASPIYNAPEDIATLVNVAAGGGVLPEGAEFRKRYVKKPSKSIFTIINPFATKDPIIVKKQELGKVLNKWVDYQKGSEEGFPSLSEERINVPMTRHQSKLHSAAWGQLPLLTRMRLKKGLPPDKKDLASINAFQSQTRQISSSVKKYNKDGGENFEIAPKILKAVDNLEKKVKENPEHRAVVYANYLSTLDDYAKKLDQQGIPYKMFRGDMSKKVREQSVRDYNEGKTKALLISGAGGEGLDLKGTRQVQVLEPHWNEEKLTQVIGRARRYKSHDHLPPKQRNVVVERYASRPLGLLGAKEGIEDILYNTAEQKKKLDNQVLDLLTKNSSLNKEALLGLVSRAINPTATRREDHTQQLPGQSAPPPAPMDSTNLSRFFSPEESEQLLRESLKRNKKIQAINQYMSREPDNVDFLDEPLSYFQKQAALDTIRDQLSKK